MADALHAIGLTAGPPKPLRRWRWSAPAIVVALATALVVVIFGIFALLCWQAFGTTLDQARAKAQTAADIIEDDIGWVLGGARANLQFVAGLGPVALDPASKPRAEAMLQTTPIDASIAVYDSAGTLRWSTGTLAMPQSIAGASYLAALQGGKDWVIPPVEADTSRLLIAQRLTGNGFSGVAVAAIPSTLLEGIWEPQKLGNGSTLVIAGEDGRLVGRYPALAGPFSVAQTSSVWPQVTSSDAGTATTVSSVDKITRVVGFRHVPGLGLVAFATISEDAAYAPIWTAIATVLWLLVPIAVMLMVFALIIARMLRQSARTNATLGAALAHNDVLFREIHHRVKNNLQSVSALLQMQPIPREIKNDMGQRIAAMAAVHEHIYRSSNFAQVRVKDYLDTLIGNIRASAAGNVTVEQEIEDVAVDKDAATPLGLIVNEVVANAFKHAFADGRAGVVRVRLVTATDGKGELTVEDNGVGFDPATPAKGIGRRLIVALTAQLNGQSGFTTAPGGGARFTLSFPLARVG